MDYYSIATNNPCKGAILSHLPSEGVLWLLYRKRLQNDFKNTKRKQKSWILSQSLEITVSKSNQLYRRSSSINLFRYFYNCANLHFQNYRSKMPQSQWSHRRRQGNLCCKSVVDSDNQSISAVDFLKQLEQINDLTDPQLRKLICDGEQNVKQHYTLLFSAMCQLLQDKKSQREQVRALHWLVYEMRDTILVAKTDFGKSIIFHAYSVLTDQITIQLISLSKLGEEQLEFIHWYSEAKPCLVTVNTKFEDSVLLSNIQAEVYTHILLGPEQATAPKFWKILQNPNFQKQIELVAIDECHVLSQWKKFRSEYVMIHKLC